MVSIFINLSMLQIHNLVIKVTKLTTFDVFDIEVQVARIIDSCKETVMK